MQITDIQLAVMVIALVGMVRAQWPKVDGKAYVFGIAAVFGVALSFLIGGQPGDTWRTLVVHGFVVALSAAGGMGALAYHADKANPVDSPIFTVQPDPAKPLQGRGNCRGCSHLGPMVMTAIFGGMLLLVGALAACSSWTRQDTKTAVDVAKGLIEQICSPDDPSLDACIDKLLTSPKFGKRPGVAADAGSDR